MGAQQEECKCPDIEERVEWIYTYADMVTLLFAFFVLLFALSQTEQEVHKAISASFRGGPPASPFFFEGLPQFMENVESILRKSDVGEESNITISDKGVAVSFNDTAFFEPGSAVPLKKACKTLEKFSGILYAVPNNVVIEGHTDNIAISTKEFPSNWELSGARAGAVARLLEKFGLDKNRIEISAFGSTQPKVSNDTPELRAINRRIDILVKPDK